MGDAQQQASEFADYFQLDDSLVFPDLALSIHAAHFHSQRYQDHYFDQNSIHFPPARKKAVNKRRSEFFTGRYLAKLALTQAGSPSHDVPADNNRCPLWPAGFRGSITHTDNYAACVLARTDQLSAVGIDIQDWMEENAAQRLAPRILNEKEQQVLASSALSASVGISLCFSAKESIFKALYPYIGHHFGYAAAKLISIDRRENKACFAFDPALQIAAIDCATLNVAFQERPHHIVTLLAIA
ncbi:phosphopantetheinyl transferase component of siderophore synthetase [Spongiibacter sp. IMCC21906]|uniref:4'-phosphopantetheinyl transferase family protein n=1 Tax=Spongiibacter sp. IMCC21906 TaxID=1620392 RepID=UPI00062DEBD7|nr:4'-phosphopantetheinyl transferase superfamily protein [Spongiibacter sp. IMCC21906]AKH67730.1 phosphopantetheinyl transferase component of siderophore synthetase [Spongiibacter sp. IMCC21906]